MSTPVNQQNLYTRRRLELLSGFMALLIIMIAIRALDLHVLQSQDLKDKATRQHFHQYNIAAPRGTIFDRKGRVLSKSIEVPSIAVIASDLPKKRINELARALHTSPKKLHARLKNRTGFTWLARQVSPATAEKVALLNIPGVRQENEWRRYHPLGPETGHILGFVGIDGHGLEGIERSLDQRLQGQPGTRLVQRDARGHALPGSTWLKEPRMGQSITLSIDSNIQSIAYAALTAGVQKQQAKGGSVIVMNPHNGEILAMANWPGFNPNSFGQFRAGQWRNRAITDMIEPGSTMKPFTVAAAIESKRWKASSLIFCEQGNFKVADYTIHDEHPEGWLNLTGLLARSSNIGAAKLALDLGPEKLRQKLSELGFGQRTAIGLGGESPGRLPSKRQWGPVETANIAFGQGIAVTPLQLAAAFSVLANQGIKTMPHLVLSNTNSQQEAVFSTKTTQDLTKMLVASTSPTGTGFRAVPAGYQVAGKTGTAQKAGGGGYVKDKFMALFAGFTPAESPEIVMVVVIDEPKKSIYGGTVAAPIFREIASATLPYLGVLPSAQKTSHWQVRQVSTAPHSIVPTGTVGQFMGKSLRQAYQLAEQQGYTLLAHGSGWVSKQSPSAFSRQAKGSELEVWLNE
ncbi:MAG: penicillin-binding transpeptidase domain-containing protein [Mariprofundaceae bacterium]